PSCPIPLASPYPPIPYPPAVPRIHPKKTAQVQRDTEEMGRILALQEQVTTRIINAPPNQMHIPPSHQQISQLTLHTMQSVPRHPSSIPSTSSSIPSTSKGYPIPIPSQFPPGVNPQAYMREYEKVMASRRKKEEGGDGGEGSEGGGEGVKRVPRLVKKKQKKQEIAKGSILLTKKISEMTTEELEEASRRARNEEIKLRLIEKNIEYKEDEHGNVLPVEKKKGGVISYPGDPRFPLPDGKDMSFYIKPDPPPPDPLSQCPSPQFKGLEYVEEVPVCTEGEKKPLLCRGYDKTKERAEYPDIFGGQYLQLIQKLFHSVNGDPRRVPNASTNGDKWEHPFKEGEEPSGLEVYRDVKGRVWNPDYDYTPVFKQLMEMGERTEYIYRNMAKERDNTRSPLGRRDLLSTEEEVPPFGNVFEAYPGSDYELDSDLSDWDDGRIAIGREPIKKKEVIEEENTDEKNEENGDNEKEKIKSEEKMKKDKKKLVRDPSKKIGDGYYPLLTANRFWGKISYNEKAHEVGAPYMCSWKFNKVYVDPNTEKVGERDRYSLSIFDRLDRDAKTARVLSQPDSSFYFKCEPGGYVILGSESGPPLFVQSPLYNAMMGEELDTIVRITKGHQMIIFDENFFNILLHQANQYGEKVLYETRQLLLTRVSCTKGWGEAYQKSTILDALVWVEMSILNPMKKIDTLLGLDLTHPHLRGAERYSTRPTALDAFVKVHEEIGIPLWID
ncbi:hypothetical protein PENTCL1PPCAC_17483, partial [Pristionchus entomophagus]